MKLTSFCLLLAGLLVLGVGITGVAGAVAGGRGWLTLVSSQATTTAKGSFKDLSKADIMKLFPPMI